MVDEENEGLNKITQRVIGAAIEVHRETGPGLLEAVYEACLCAELERRGLRFETQVELPVRYKGKSLNCGFRIDMLVEGAVIVELKTVERVLPVHKSQLLTYLRLANRRLGLLLNFNVPTMASGISRVVNDF